MVVHIPSPLWSYTGGASEVEARGSTLSEILDDLNRQFPGIRFRVIDEQDRVRAHIKLFVNSTMVNLVSGAVGPADEVTIVCSLSGG